MRLILIKHLFKVWLLRSLVLKWITMFSFVSILLYGCTTSTPTKQLEKKLDCNNTRMLRAILNKRQHLTKQQLYGHLPPIKKTIQVRRTRHAGHCWRSRDELISDVLLWTPSRGWTNVGRPARTYIQQLCEDTGCIPGDQPETMSNRERWRERVRDIRTDSTIRWWWDDNWVLLCRHIGSFTGLSWNSYIVVALSLRFYSL